LSGPERFPPAIGGLIRGELERVVATLGISKDVFEQASKSVA
jgi:aminopeptidase N